MFSRPAALFAIAMLAAGAALAQEYGRASGGELSILTKRPARLSGSLGFGQSSLFGKQLEGTLGGTVVPDRLWFFGSVQRSDAMRVAPALSQVVTAPLSAASGKVDAYFGDRQSLAAIAGKSAFTPQTVFTVPSSFLSLHYTGVISDSAFFTASVSHSH